MKSILKRAGVLCATAVLLSVGIASASAYADAEFCGESSDAQVVSCAPSIDDAGPEGDANVSDEQQKGTPSDASNDTSAADRNSAVNGEFDSDSSVPNAESPIEPEKPNFEVDSTIEEGLYEIKNEISEKLLDVSGASKNDCANVQVWNGNSSPAQRWRISRVDGHYAIKNVASGKALDVANGSSLSGSSVQQFQWNGTKAQLWDFVKAQDGCYYLRSCVGDKYLDVSGGSSASGANVQIYAWNGTPAQMWRLVATRRVLEDGTYSFSSTVNGSQAIDVSGALDSNSAAVQSYVSNKTLAQYWNVIYDDKTGYYEIRSASSGLALDVAGGGSVSGTKVQQYAPNGTLAQRWTIVEKADGSISFIAANSGLALDLPGGNACNGNQLQVYAPNGTPAQRWRALCVEASLPNGLFQISSRIDGGKVLDVSGGSLSQSAKNQIWVKNGTLAQKWVIKKRENGLYSLQNANSGWYLGDNNGSLFGCDSANDSNAQWVPFFSLSGGYGLMNALSGKVLDISGGNACAGGIVQLWGRNDTAAQGWKIVSCDILESRYYVFQNVPSRNKALDVSNASNKSGSLVQLWDANGSNAQKWLPSKNSDGTYSFISVCSGKFLDVRDGEIDAGAVIQQWDENGTSAQKWRVSIGGNGGMVVASASGAFSLGVKDGKLTLLSGSEIAQRWNVVEAYAGMQSYHMANSVQGRIVEFAKNTPSPGANLCSEWVAEVFEKIGLEYDHGDACDYFWSYCSSSDLNDLRVGMIVGVPSHSHNVAGSIWGHVCIYIGDGKVMDNVGRVRTMGLQDWSNYYGTTYWPQWGWYRNAALV